MIADAMRDLLIAHAADSDDSIISTSFDDALDDALDDIITYAHDLSMRDCTALLTLAQLLADARDDASIAPAIRDTLRDNTTFTIL